MLKSSYKGKRGQVLVEEGGVFYIRRKDGFRIPYDVRGLVLEDLSNLQDDNIPSYRVAKDEEIIALFNRIFGENQSKPSFRIATDSQIIELFNRIFNPIE